MKKLLSFIFLLSVVLGSHAQRSDLPVKPSEAVSYVKSLGIQFEDANAMFTQKPVPANKQSEMQKVVRKSVLLNFHQTSAKRLLGSTGEAMRLSLPLPDGRNAELELVKVNLFAPGFFVNASDHPAPLDVDLGVHYRGVVKGVPGSIASISIFDNEVMGLFSTPADGNYVLGRLDGENKAGDHVLYNDRDFIPKFDFVCDMDDDVESFYDEEHHTGHVNKTTANECIKVYMEVDDDVVTNKGGTTGATNYITGLFAEVATIYANENLTYQISQIFNWTTTSPYAGLGTTSTATWLNEFKAQTSSINGDLGHLVSYRMSGGRAAGFDGLCNSNVDNSLCVSDIYSTYSNYPTYSWSVMVLTHEMGHLNGSRHTHACVWNGNNTAIDGCAGSTEGSCALPGNPSGGGTIMSYCHITSVGINLSLGFGPQPGDRIRDEAASASCLSCGGSGSGCTTTISSFPYSESFESGFGAWSNASGDDINWTRDSGGTPSSGTGPSSAANGTWYMYTESSGSGTGYPNKVGVLNGPCFNLSGVSNPTFNFSYHMYGSAMGTLQLQASTNSGSSWTTLRTINGNQGNNWASISQSLNSYIGQSVWIRFRATTGSSYTSDITIDNISVTTGGISGPCANYDFEGFETNFGIWSDGGGDFAWTRRSGSTPSTNTGPTSAYSGSYYAYTESSYPNYPSKTAILVSSCVELDYYFDAEISFRYHMYGATMGSLQVQISTNNGSSWTNLWTVSGNQGNSWLYKTINLDSYIPQDAIFRFYATTGSSYTGDIAIDNVNIDGFIDLPPGLSAEGLVQKLDLYPNPAADHLNIEYATTQDSNVEFQVVDFTGRVVKQYIKNAFAGSNDYTISLNDLPAGTYMLVAKNGDERINKRFVHAK